MIITKIRMNQLVGNYFPIIPIFISYSIILVF